MASLRKILAANIKAYRNELGLSQSKLAYLVDTAPNYIAMIEGEKRFPTDTMLEKIADALNRESFELFAVEPIRKRWQEELLAELAVFISNKLSCLSEKERKTEYLTS
ncbi:MAG: helix-turn-helix transcriptional regulator [Spirochaetaceae bacterium]|jgi:transcriptional regulator with XRE-family HTH domain|nr:helix-turn-helix transcriptional regulator [Spirochaetaceae bacterium]